MEQEEHAFYVVKKGDVVGIFNNFNDFQAQIDSSGCDRSVSVYKGYCLPQDAEKHFSSCGLKNAIYSFSASDLKADILGKLVACPYQQSASIGAHSVNPLVAKSKDSVRHDNLRSCIIEFDGASKGNPGLAGAGAVIRAEDGKLICGAREGLGFATNNVAEYKALILGLKFALKKGFKSIHVRGDSQLVCRQVEGTYKTKNPNLTILCKEVNELKLQFLSFDIQHVARELNSEADAQANLAVNLQAGQVVEDCPMK